MTTEEQIAWLVANTSATNTIIRALGEAMQRDQNFVDSVIRLHTLRAGKFLASPMNDAAIAAYEEALKDLLPISVREKVFP